MRPVVLSHFTATSCLGAGLAPHITALRIGASGLKPCQFETVQLDTCVGEVIGVNAEVLPVALREFDCRNNRLAYLAQRQDGFAEAVAATIARVGRRRVGLFLGTSTSGILETEIGYRHRDPVSGALPTAPAYHATHNTFSLGAFLRQLWQVEGPTVVVSTACSSSAKVFGSAQRMMAAGLIDAAVVGGVDSLCLTTLYGFHSLQLTARRPCRPFAKDRDGISIGEAGAFALLQRADSQAPGDGIALFGVGESNDAYHISTPHPDGVGAQMAMAAALRAAQLEPAQIDYVNLHGTATATNDQAESRALLALFGKNTACSSTKGATGHTLGAAGAVEAVLCAATMTAAFMPGGTRGTTADPDLGLRYLNASQAAATSRVLSNSFGFGGTNCSLILGRME